jgi:hypothetical protein
VARDAFCGGLRVSPAGEERCWGAIEGRIAVDLAGVRRNRDAVRRSECLRGVAEGDWTCLFGRLGAIGRPPERLEASFEPVARAVDGEHLGVVE